MKKKHCSLLIWYNSHWCGSNYGYQIRVMNLFFDLIFARVVIANGERFSFFFKHRIVILLFNIWTHFAVKDLFIILSPFDSAFLYFFDHSSNGALNFESCFFHSLGIEFQKECDSHDYDDHHHESPTTCERMFCYWFTNQKYWEIWQLIACD